MENMKALHSIFQHSVWDVEDILQLSRGLLDGDFERITSSSKARGFNRIFLLRLPELCSDLERSLDSGELRWSNGEFVVNGKLTLFNPVISLIFDEDGSLLPHACSSAIRCFRQLTKLFKKLRVQCSAQSIKDKIDEFRTIEAELPSPSLSWGTLDLHFDGFYPSLTDLDRIRSDAEVEYLESVGTTERTKDLSRDLSAVQSVADRVVRSFVIKEGNFKPKHGPGAVSEPFEESKYEFPTWPERLDKLFPYLKWGCINDLNYEIGDVLEDPPAKLIDVPKDFKGPRLIASEPISSQFIQQGILNSIRSSLKGSILRYSYNPYSQEPSRELVLSSSRDRSFSTIDLSSASDRLSCYVVERIFRKNYIFLQQLNSARTPCIKYPDGQISVLRKFAAQGAAFTFPVQSLVYAIICIGVIYSSNPTARLVDLAKMVRVFGDDIIIPTEYFERTKVVLEALFLKVNASKSFSNGYFRESCGMDAYQGNDVSAVSILDLFQRSKPETLVSLVECSNNLYIKGFIRTAQRLQETLPRKIRLRIPSKMPDSGYFGLVCSGKTEHKTRWCQHWQLRESLVLVVETKLLKTKPKALYCLHQWFIEEPRPDVRWVPGEVTRVKTRYSLRWVPSEILGR